MKKEIGYVKGLIMLIGSLILYAVPFALLYVIFDLLISSVIKDPFILNILDQILSLVYFMSVAYFAVKTFSIKQKTPNNKKLIIVTFTVLVIIELLGILFGERRSVLVISFEIIQMILLYPVILYSIKKNSNI